MFAALRCFEAYIEWIGSRPNGPHTVQCDFVMDENGTPLVDFIGRFERLTYDFGIFAGRLGIHPHLPHLNCSGEYPIFGSSIRHQLEISWPIFIAPIWTRSVTTFEKADVLLPGAQHDAFAFHE